MGANQSLPPICPNFTRPPQLEFEAQVADRREKPGDIDARCATAAQSEKDPRTDAEVLRVRMPEAQLALSDP
jgi:hypothetical protein